MSISKPAAEKTKDVSKYECPYCENIHVDYDEDSKKFETFECPQCSSDVYFDDCKK